MQEILQDLARNPARSCKKSCKILQDLARCLTRSCKTSSKILYDNLAPAYARILQDSCTSKQSCKIISGKSCKTCKKVAKLRARLQDSCKSCKMMCKIFYYLAARFVQDLARLFYMGRLTSLLLGTACRGNVAFLTTIITQGVPKFAAGWRMITASTPVTWLLFFTSHDMCHPFTSLQL